MTNTHAYRIVDWEHHYENNRTRDMKMMAWVPVPVKHDGYGYCKLVSELGAAGLGSWLAILQTAAKSHPRGTLLRDRKTPHTAESIAVTTRLKPDIIDKTLKLCCSTDIKWIEVVDIQGDKIQTAEIPHLPAEIPHEPARNGMEEKGNERKGNTHPQTGGVCGFNEFWTAYPRKTGKKAALKAWKAAKDKPDIQTIIAAITAQKASQQWQKDGGQFIPHPATWLNQGRWADVVKVDIKKPLSEHERRIAAGKRNLENAY